MSFGERLLLPRPRSPRFAGDLTSRQSGYNLARMPFEIVLAPEAVEDLKGLKANIRAEVRVAIERHFAA
jgi:hypothetical protein